MDGVGMRCARGHMWIALWYSMVRDNLVTMGVDLKLVDAMDETLAGLGETFEHLAKIHELALAQVVNQPPAA